MKITDRTFKGINKKVDAEQLPDGYAQVAENVNLEKGAILPVDNELGDTVLSLSTTVQTIFKFLSTYFFEWAADVNIAHGPIAADTTNKIYYTGDGIPKKTNQAEATTGSPPYPVNFFPLGVPSPLVAPTVALGAGGSGDARDLVYIWTIITSWGEESLPSDASGEISAMPGQAVDLSGMTIEWQAATAYTTGNWVVPTVLGDYVYKCVTAGTSGATEPASWGTTVDEDTTDGAVSWRCYKKSILFDSPATKRIYRSNYGNSTSNWQLVTEIAMTATTHSDSATTLEETYLASEAYDPPPDDLIGLAEISGGFLAGFKGKDVYFSEPYRLHAFPIDYIQTMPFTVVSVSDGPGNTVVVTTTENPYVLVGTHPGSLTPIKMGDPKGSVSKRGAVSHQAGVLYPSKTGLELVAGTGNTGSTVTDGMFTKKEWAALHPETFNSVFYDGAYYGFYSSGGDTGCIVINFETGIITTLDFYVSAAWVDPADETLYYVKRVAEARLTESGTPLPARTGSRLTEAGDYRLLEE